MHQPALKTFLRETILKLLKVIFWEMASANSWYPLTYNKRNEKNKIVAFSKIVSVKIKMLAIFKILHFLDLHNIGLDKNIRLALLRSIYGFMAQISQFLKLFWSMAHPRYRFPCSSVDNIVYFSTFIERNRQYPLLDKLPKRSFTQFPLNLAYSDPHLLSATHRHSTPET